MSQLGNGLTSNGDFMKAMWLAGVLWSVLSPHIALADPTHENDILVGSRASGVGGAYTAVADDVSSIHYNHAGLSLMGKDVELQPE
jgi:hypothetical protein